MHASVLAPRLHWPLAPLQMNAMMVYAHIPAAELHARGVLDHIIRFVEQHRAQLQRSVQQPLSFRGHYFQVTRTALGLVSP